MTPQVDRLLEAATDISLNNRSWGILSQAFVAAQLEPDRFPVRPSPPLLLRPRHCFAAAPSAPAAPLRGCQLVAPESARQRQRAPCACYFSSDRLPARARPLCSLIGRP